MNLFGKISFHDEKRNLYTFTVNKSLNPDPKTFAALDKISSKLDERYPDSFKPLYPKEYNDHSYYSLSARVSNFTDKPIVGNSYSFTMNLATSKWNDKDIITAHVKKLRLYEEQYDLLNFADLTA